MNKVLLFNPRSANSKYRIPNSILQIAASIEGKYEYVIVDGNLENNPAEKIINILRSNEFAFFGCTVMPGPQLKQAIPISKEINNLFPQIKIIWGGYFPSNQYKTVINSGFVDFIIDGPGDNAFPALLSVINSLGEINTVKNLIYRFGEEIIKTAKEEILEQDNLPLLPYEKLNNFYPLKQYLGKTYLGSKTLAYHSSVGCPFTCSFCAVVPIYKARWKGKSAGKIYRDIKHLKDTHNIDAIEFHDNNFFVSEKRVAEFSELIKNEGIVWWGEGRIDTIDKYSDATLQLMRKAGCKMIFFGAETGSDEMLKKMDKGGTQSSSQIKKFAKRMLDFDIIPEYSFVLGFPAETEAEVVAQIQYEIKFIREIKEINRNAEIIIYVYSPVATEGSELYERVKKAGFHFPEKLEDWLKEDWLNFDLRKNPLTPWLKPYMIDLIKDFETTLNGYYPTITDYKITTFQRNVIRALSAFRYRYSIYKFPIEIKILQKFWLKYRRPEKEGF